MRDENQLMLRALLRGAVRRRNRGYGAIGLNGWRADLFRVIQGVGRGLRQPAPAPSWLPRNG